MLERTYWASKSCKWTGVAVKPWEAKFLERSLINTFMEVIIGSEE